MSAAEGCPQPAAPVPQPELPVPSRAPAGSICCGVAVTPAPPPLLVGVVAAAAEPPVAVEVALPVKLDR